MGGWKASSRRDDGDQNPVEIVPTLVNSLFRYALRVSHGLAALRIAFGLSVFYSLLD